MKDSPPDLILSGVNRGANLAEDVTYSGTVSAAMEGALAGVPSIALSQTYAREGLGDTVPFSAAGGWAEEVLRTLTAEPMAESDPRIRPLLERYCKLAKVKLLPRADDLFEMKLPTSERAHFGERATVRVALSLDALEREPDAEMAVLGSPFLGALVAAIRTRVGRLSLGMIAP